jgi:hypothetical protein
MSHGAEKRPAKEAVPADGDRAAHLRLTIWRLKMWRLELRHVPSRAAEAEGIAITDDAKGGFVRAETANTHERRPGA